MSDDSLTLTLREMYRAELAAVDEAAIRLEIEEAGFGWTFLGEPEDRDGRITMVRWTGEGREEREFDAKREATVHEPSPGLRSAANAVTRRVAKT